MRRCAPWALTLAVLVTAGARSHSQDQKKQQPAVAGEGDTAVVETASREQVRAQILEHLDTLAVSIGIDPDDKDMKDDSIKIRELLLHVPLLHIEPSSRWSDGTEVSLNSRLTTEQGKALVEYLLNGGLLDRATTFHSPRTAAPSSPPPRGSTDKLPTGPAGRKVSIRVSVHDDSWYRDHFIFLPWETPTLDVLRGIRAALAGENADPLNVTLEAFLKPLDAALKRHGSK